MRCPFPWCVCAWSKLGTRVVKCAPQLNEIFRLFANWARIPEGHAVDWHIYTVAMRPDCSVETPVLRVPGIEGRLRRSV